MQVTRWNTRRIALAACGIFVLYWIFSASRQSYTAETTIKNVNPELVWEYVADFQKMQTLNPTILNFKITNDQGNFNHWRYSATYTERLSHWPYWLNEATADFEVKKLHDNELGQYSVESNHRTCFLFGLYCLYSSGKFYFAADRSDTRCMEVVQYECPPFLGLMCRREVIYQRKAIMQNLKKKFNPQQ